MRYSLLAGGKRIRPVLALATARAIELEYSVLPLAAALELIHTYSLIHDDLPAMDDDDLRRGRPTCHKAFGEDVAILAGDALYAEAFQHLTHHQDGNPRAVLAAVCELAAATGVEGMVGGQYLDVKGLSENLRQLHALKTGRLIGASVECVLLLDGSTRIEPYRDFAAELGVLFQIVDDILDVTGTDAALGKPRGSDERHGKTDVRELLRPRGEHTPSRRSHTRRPGRPWQRRHRPSPPSWNRSPTSSSSAPLDRDPPRQRSTDRRTCTGSPSRSCSSLAQEVRELLIDTVGEIGGHFGANLGTCEIAVAIHSLLDSPRDKVLWDVGHNAYPHKILTGRRDRLHTIRQYGGLAPFCATFESEHDIMGAGHASTSIGYGVGIKEAMRRGHAPDGKVVAVIGDGSMTGGVAFEAVHQAGGLGTPLVVVLNDNGMSIAPNVGALNSYFNRLRLEPHAWKARERLEEKLTRLPAGIGARIEKLGPQVKEALKAYWAPGLWWEELDWAYIGVVDGHDVKAMRRALKEALAAERPVVIHAATVKGKGFAPAEDGGLEGMERWHAAKPKSIANGAPVKAAVKAKDPAAPTPPPTWTEVFGHAMVEEVRRDRRVVGITAAMNSGTGLNILQKEEPDHYFDVGIAEQQAILFASGLALTGSRPVAAIYSTFLQRAYDQIVHDVCLQNLPVVFCMDRAGLVGDDGPTHHGVFDIPYLRCLPNMTLMAPRDEAMLRRMLRTALQLEGPSAIRYPRGAAAGVEIPAEPEPLEVGTGEILREGRGVALLGYGCGGRKGTRRGGHPRRRHRRRRALRQAARRGPAGAAGRRARPARDRRGRRAAGRLRQRRPGTTPATGFRSPCAAGPAHRPAGPLRHPRRPQAPARRGRFHRRGDRRARRRRRARRHAGLTSGLNRGRPAADQISNGG